MRLSVRQDIEAPGEVVFARMTDVAHFERVALRRGAEIDRMDPSLGASAGARWKVAFPFRGKRREVLATISEFEAPTGFTVALASKGLEGTSEVDLVPLSPARTRVTFALDLKPRTLAGRLMLQSMKLAKSTMQTRLRDRLAAYARDIEDGWRKGGA